MSAAAPPAAPDHTKIHETLCGAFTGQTDDMRSKDATERVAEMLQIRRKLAELGLDPHLPDEFLEACQRFARTGEGASGSISMPGTGRTLVYTLALRHGAESSVRLTRV